MWGCTAPAKQKVEIEGVPLTNCPLRLFLDHTDDMAEIVWYYTGYKRGQLPEAGGLLDQPALMMSIFKVIDAANAKVERAKEDEADRKRKADAARATRGRR